jgi:hypothetical protein
MNASGRRPGSQNNKTKLAIREMQSSVGKAVRVLVRALDSQNEWVSFAAAKLLLERVIPPAEMADLNNNGPLIVFPQGAKIDVALREGHTAAIPADPGRTGGSPGSDHAA